MIDSTTLPPAQFKDRKVGLVIFGVATLFAGCLCALFVPLLILGTTAAAHSASPPPSVNIVPIALLYCVLAIVLISLGIGSIMMRRWARALIAIWSWSWLIAGVLSVTAFAVILPQIAKNIQTQRPGQPNFSVLMLAPIIIMGFIFIVLPLIWGLFYSGRNVKATCEARDPVTRWTDRCPLPVLAACLWLGFGMLSMLLVPAFHSAVPFFGRFISGAPGTVLYLFMAIVWAYCAWGLYRLDRRAWWVIFATLILFGISNFITYSQHDLSEVYASMGYQPAQVAEIRKLAFVQKQTMRWTVVLFTVPFLGYLIYIRKFLKNAA